MTFEEARERARQDLVDVVRAASSLCNYQGEFTFQLVEDNIEITDMMPPPWVEIVSSIVQMRNKPLLKMKWHLRNLSPTTNKGKPKISPTMCYVHVVIGHS